MNDGKDASKDLNEHTRAVYHQQHVRQGEDSVTRERLMSITSHRFFDVPADFFENKRVLDAGCGSIVRNAIAFHKMGAPDVIAMDLGDEWFETAYRNMERYAVPKGAIELVNGNVAELPFDTESFDFVCVDGVLPHLADESQVERTIAEAGRVTRRGGHLFLSYLGGGGLIETKLHDAARQFYRDSPAFARIIDNIKPSTLHELVDYVVRELSARSDKPVEPNWNAVKELLDEDLCIAIQNLLQAQRREHHRQERVNMLLNRAGFAEPKRIKRYVQRKNIRKFVAPLHFDSGHPFAQLLYGDGWIDCIAQKR